MNCQVGTYEGLQYLSTECAEQETQDVHEDDYSCGELYLQPPLHADDDGHGHRKNRKEQFVINSTSPAYQGNAGMQQSEQVYDSGYFYIGSHAVSFSKVIRR